MWTLRLALLASLLAASAVRAQDAGGAPVGAGATVTAVQARDPARESAKEEVRPPLREQDCLSPADMREVLEAKRVIDPVAAIRAAQAAVPRAEIVRANLCLVEEHFLYLLTALRRDGHFVHVTVNAESSKVAALW